MKILNPIRAAVLRRCRRIMARREPDFVIGDNYLRRWWLIPRNRWLNVYLHEFRASDDDRALHDHPWPSASIMLQGFYWEHTPAQPADPGNGETVKHWRSAGDITTRRAQAAHRIELQRGPDGALMPAVSLFITGPRGREWGFWCRHGWRSWRVFTSPNNKGQIGRGCE